jgi:integrase
MFNLADHWQLFFGRNSVRGVKFLQEDNLQIRSLSEAEEEKLLQCCSPYLQDLVTFAINTGLRLGEILNLRWRRWTWRTPLSECWYGRIGACWKSR